ncbi:sortase [Candidatus Kaiserbacteria bacterium]|nr:sortase [Candidatus Kaiserbacteria bacterium]
MGRIIDATVRLVGAGKRTYARKWSFLWLFAIAFFSSVAVLGQLDLLPEKPIAVVAPIEIETAAATVPELPAKIEIIKINLSANVVNPTTTDIAALDKELLKGAVRYPTSAKLGENGNVVLFGHSSYLPVVKNQAFKTFNGIQKLAPGDIIMISSLNVTYTYQVRSVVKEKADENTAIPLSVAGKALTLVTCDSFGTKTDRFVVTADFVESSAVSG